jgi:hypothetical protein
MVWEFRRCEEGTNIIQNIGRTSEEKELLQDLVTDDCDPWSYIPEYILSRSD